MELTIGTITTLGVVTTILTAIFRYEITREMVRASEDIDEARIVLLVLDPVVSVEHLVRKKQSPSPVKTEIIVKEILTLW